MTEQDINKPLSRFLKEGEYVLVQFTTKKIKPFYIGKVIEERNENLEFYISFLMKKACNKYHFPAILDLSNVKDDDVKFVLPKPTFSGSTTRQQNYYSFSIDLS